jgi:hypothetical protein
LSTPSGIIAGSARSETLNAIENSSERPKTHITVVTKSGSPSKQTKYFKAAQTCFNKLHATKPKENNRREWMLCVGRLRNTYLSDPEGFLAAHALYMEGVLYSSLYNGLNYRSDNRAARENFKEVIDTSPNRPFANMAAAELRAMSTVRKPDQGIGKAEAASSNIPKASSPERSVLSTNQKHSSTPPLAVLSQFRYWPDASYTRVVVHTDHEVNFSIIYSRKTPF